MIGFTGHPSDNLVPCAIMLILLGLGVYNLRQYQQQQAAQQASPAPVSSTAQVESGSSSE